MEYAQHEISDLREAVAERDSRIQDLEGQLRMLEQERALLKSEDHHLHRLSVQLAAHNFRNMLTVLSAYFQRNSFASQSQGSLLDEEEQQDVEGALQQAKHQAARMMDWHTPDDPRRVDPNDEVRDFARMIRVALPSEIEMRVLLDAGASTILAPPRMLIDALMNIALNARDAIGPDGGTLTLTTRADDHYVVIEMADDGHGMSDAVRERIFKPYFTTKGSQGTGLGMASIAELFDRVDGHYEVKSRQGEGTVVSLHFPVKNFDSRGPR